MKWFKVATVYITWEYFYKFVEFHIFHIHLLVLISSSYAPRGEYDLNSVIILLALIA